MKTFTTSGTGSQQTLSELETDKLPLYNTLADAEADLANLEENQIVATKDTGDELAQPVNVVQAGNLHAVTSNAVAEMFSAPLSDDFEISFSNQTANCTGILYVNIVKQNTSTVTIKEDNTSILGTDLGTTDSKVSGFTVFIRKGHQYMIDKSGDTSCTIYFQKFIKIC